MRKVGALALVALLILIPVSAASAKSKSKVDAFAAKHHLKGAWKAKDADKDGLKNLKEFKLGTNPKKADTDKDGLKDGDEVMSANNPRKADTDGDGTKDGAEHAGVVTAFDGESITIREFATGKKVTATLDTDCSPAADEASLEDDGEFVEVTDEEFVPDFSANASTVDGDGEEEVVDLGDEDTVDADAASCDDEDLEPGAVLNSAEFDGGFLVAFELA